MGEVGEKLRGIEGRGGRRPSLENPTGRPSTQNIRRKGKVQREPNFVGVLKTKTLLPSILLRQKRHLYQKNLKRHRPQGRGKSTTRTAVWQLREEIGHRF